jgi:hypothetical protein
MSDDSNGAGLTPRQLGIAMEPDSAVWVETVMARYDRILRASTVVKEAGAGYWIAEVSAQIRACDQIIRMAFDLLDMAALQNEAGEVLYPAPLVRLTLIRVAALALVGITTLDREFEAQLAELPPGTALPDEMPPAVPAAVDQAGAA